MENKKLISVQLNLKSLCNLRCLYCALPEESKNQQLTNIELQELKDIITKNTHELCKMATKANYIFTTAGFYGAEPTIVPAQLLGECINIIKSYFPDIFIKVQTNGTLINKQYVSLLEKTLDDQGRITIGFSIDGCKEIHDKYRNNSYDIAMTNMLNVHRHTQFHALPVVTTGPQHEKFQEQMSSWLYNLRKQGIEPHYSFLGGTQGISNDHFVTWFTKFLIDNNAIFNAAKLTNPKYCYRQGNGCSKMLFDLYDGQMSLCEKVFDKNNPVTQWNNKEFEEVVEIRADLVKDKELSEECKTCKYDIFCNGGCHIHREKGLPSTCKATKILFDYLGDNWMDDIMTKQIPLYKEKIL